MSAAQTPYGTDDSGLIWGYRFSGTGPAIALDSTAAADALAAARDPAREHGEFFWLHFNLAHAGATRWLERHGGLPAQFFESLADELRSTRVERDEDTLVAVLNDVHYDFSFDASDETATLWASIDRHLVLTARQSPLRSVDRLRTALRQGLVIRSTTELLEQFLRSQADVLIGIVRGATRRVDLVEDELLAGRLHVKRARLGALRRLLVRLQRLLAPEPASLFRLLQHPPEWMDADDVQNLREASEEFSVALRDMASLQERIRLLLEEVGAAVNERTGRTLFVLTVLTVLALPINILAGLFGMNVGGIPLAQDPNGFWIVAALVLVITVIGGWLAFRDLDK